MDFEAFMTLQSRQVLTFLTVAETGSFHEASRKLLVSQPALTKQVKLLEEGLGFPLFKRSRKGVELTEAGAIYLAGMKGCVEAYMELLSRCRQHARGEAGSLRVGYYTNPFIRRSFSLSVADAMKKAHPQLDIQLVEIAVDGGFEALREGRIDVFTGFDSTACDQPNIRFVPLGEAPLYCVAPPESPLCQREPLRVEDLQDLAVLLPKYGAFRCTDSIRDRLLELGNRAVEDRIFDNSTIVQAHFAGQVVVAFGNPRYLGKGKALPLSWRLPAAHGVICRQDGGGAVQAFIETAQALRDQTGEEGE